MRGSGRSRGGRALTALSFVVIALLAACTTTPPPPVVNSTPIAATSTPSAGTPSQITVSVDDIAGGYNPHTLADASTVTSALSAMLLPSVFRPGENGQLELDERLMTSAEVTSREPFTVSYEIRPEASWSDGAPIAVEDFVYLADAMRNQPGLIGAAGYRLIDDIRPGAGGKRLEVVFSEPYPSWKTLFDNLLPAHLLKDAPGGWQSALADEFPTYGGPFSIKTIDNARGEIIIERNERYWEKPAAVDRIVLRSADHDGMAGALRSGNDQFALTSLDEQGLEQLKELGDDVELHTVARPYLAEVLLRPAGQLADDELRAAVAALIDREALIEAGTGGGPSARLSAGSQVVPPSAEDYRSTAPGSGPPVEPAPGEAKRLLEKQGYALEGGTWQQDGQPLSLAIASPGQQEPYAAIAGELADQLSEAGIEVTTVSPPARTLFANHLAAPVRSGDGATSTASPGDQDSGEGASGEGDSTTADIAVVPQSVSDDPATTLASNFGCPPGWDEASGGTTGGETGETDSTGDTEATEAQRPANTAAFCDEELQPAIEDALTGAKPLRPTLAAVEPSLWESNVAIPLFQLSDTLAIGSGVAGVAPGPMLTGPFSSAVNWTRTPR